MDQSRGFQVFNRDDCRHRTIIALTCEAFFAGYDAVEQGAKILIRRACRHRCHALS
jgi:hypothetical protein